MSVECIFGVYLDDYHSRLGIQLLKENGYKEQMEGTKLIFGCNHQFNREQANFCYVCGNPSFRQEEPVKYQNLIFEVTQDIEEKTEMDLGYIEDCGWVIGVVIHNGDYREILKKIKKAIPKLKKMFPNEMPCFHN